MKIRAVILLMLLALAGCSTAKEPDMVGAPYHENALYNYYLGRDYMARGRYELARERFLLALACSRNEDMRLMAAAELEAAQRQIESQR